MEFSKPTSNDRITSDFGWRWNGTDFHSGVDYGWDRDKLSTDINFVINMADGVVKKVGWDRDGWGNYIVMDYGGYFAVYAHLDSVLVMRDKKYSKGTRIGEMGNTGASKGKHLHFEIRVCEWKDFFERYGNGEGKNSVDPIRFYLENSKRKESDLDLSNVSGWAIEDWVHFYLNGVNDGRDPKKTVTEEQLMVFFRKLNIGGK